MSGYKDRKVLEKTAIKDYLKKSNESIGDHDELMVNHGLPGSLTKKALAAAETRLKS